MLSSSRSTGFMNSNDGSKVAPGASTPCSFIGVDAYTGANVSNIVIYNGSNSNAAVFCMKTPANSSQNYDLHIPAYCEYGIWIEFADGKNGTNAVVRFG